VLTTMRAVGRVSRTGQGWGPLKGAKVSRTQHRDGQAHIRAVLLVLLIS
jgi:hypothetical protein